MRGAVTLSIVFFYGFALMVLIVLISFLVLSDLQDLQRTLGINTLIKTIKLEDLEAVFQNYMNTAVTMLEKNTELNVPETFIMNKGKLTSDHFYDAF